jgi:hypothetical protein
VSDLEGRPGGKDNYAADRRVADKILEIAPDARIIARENRKFLQRAVRFLAGEAGIRQFIDIGTGLPSQGNVHEVAQGISEDARVVYVDYDPVVISHAQALLADEKTVTAVRGDLRHPSGDWHREWGSRPGRTIVYGGAGKKP